MPFHPLPACLSTSSPDCRQAGNDSEKDIPYLEIASQRLVTPWVKNCFITL